MIVKRQVSRWFVKGKGYATLTAAARRIARDEIREKARTIHYRLSKENPDAWADIDADRILWWRSYGELFPPGIGYGGQPRAEVFSKEAREEAIRVRALEIAKGYRVTPTIKLRGEG